MTLTAKEALFMFVSAVVATVFVRFVEMLGVSGGIPLFFIWLASATWGTVVLTSRYGNTEEEDQDAVTK